MSPLGPESNQAWNAPSSADSQTGRPSSEENPASNPGNWAALLGQGDIPVLRSTVEALAKLRRNQDNIVARDISRVILGDPMLTLRLLRNLREQRKDSQATEITTVEHAVMMLGITPFFRRFREMNVVEEMLGAHPRALAGFMAVVDRARHAALHAREWAALRHDIESDEVVIAALLHDIGEMLLWCRAPECAIRLSETMRQDRALRSAAAQEAVIGFRLIDFQLALVDNWHLPALLRSLMDDYHINLPRARIVALAVALARHSANGWDDAALPDDYAAIQKLLAVPQHEVMERIRRVALRAIRERVWHDSVQPAAALLPFFPAASTGAASDAGMDSAATRAEVLKRVTAQLMARGAPSLDFLGILSLVFHGMRAGLGLERLLFMEISGERRQAAAKYILGSGDALPLRHLRIDLDRPHVFSRLMVGGMRAWYSGAGRDEPYSCLPEVIQPVVGNNEFFAMAVPMNGTPLGLLYADGGPAHPVLEADTYAEFQRLGLLFAAALAGAPEFPLNGN